MNSEPEVVQSVDQQLSVPKALVLAVSQHQDVVNVNYETNSHRTEVPNDGLQDLRGQPWGWCEAERHRLTLVLPTLPHEEEVLAILWFDREMEEVV